MKKLKLTLLLAIAALCGSQAMAQSVSVTIWPTPKHTLSPKTETFCADSTQKTYTATKNGTFNYATTADSITWTILSTGAAGNIIGASNEMSINVMWAAVTSQQTGKIAFAAKSDHDCHFYDTITVTINPAPTFTLLANSKTACVSNTVDLLQAFISQNANDFTGYTYSNEVTLRGDLKFYEDAAHTISIADGYYTPATTGAKTIYARLEGNVSCNSKTYNFVLDVRQEPIVTLAGTVANPTDTAKVCQNVAINLKALATPGNAGDTIQFSFDRDFATLIGNPGAYTPTTVFADTIFVRGTTPGIDLPCVSLGNNVKWFNFKVNPAITNVKLAVLDGSGTSQGDDQNAEMCQESAGAQKADGTITLTFRATMEGGSQVFSDLRWLPGTSTAAQTNPHTGASALDFTLPDQPADATARIYKLTTATDSNGCIWTNPAP